MPFATTNYGWTLPDAGAEPFSWEPFVRTAFQGIDTTMFSKFDKGGGTINGPVRATKLSVGDNTDYDLNIKNAASSSSSANMHLLSGNAAASGVYFSDTDANAMGRMQYEHATDTLKLFSGGGIRFTQTTSLTTIDNPLIVSNTASFAGANCLVAANGDLTNTNNSYGAISDAKLKRDVTDTGPKLSKVLAMRIVNYYLIADPSNTKLLGMIAQELREISPGLVEETPDYADVIVTPARTETVTRQRQRTEPRTVTRWRIELRNGAAVRVPLQVTEQVPVFENIPLMDQSGQRIVDVVNGQQVPAVHRQPVMEDYTETVQVPARIERRATGATTLSIKYSVLVPMLVKAMQELHADFDGRLKSIGA